MVVALFRSEGAAVPTRAPRVSPREGRGGRAGVQSPWNKGLVLSYAIERRLYLFVEAKAIVAEESNVPEGFV